MNHHSKRLRIPACVAASLLFAAGLAGTAALTHMNLISAASAQTHEEGAHGGGHASGGHSGGGCAGGCESDHTSESGAEHEGGSGHAGPGGKQYRGGRIELPRGEGSLLEDKVLHSGHEEEETSGQHPGKKGRGKAQDSHGEGDSGHTDEQHESH